MDSEPIAPRHLYRRAVGDSTLPGVAKAALQCLADMATRKDGVMGQAWPCHGSLGRQIGFSRSSVGRALVACEASGWVVVQRRVGQAHRYTLTIPSTFERHPLPLDDAEESQYEAGDGCVTDPQGVRQSDVGGCVTGPQVLRQSDVGGCVRAPQGCVRAPQGVRQSAALRDYRDQERPDQRPESQPSEYPQPEPTSTTDMPIDIETPSTAEQQLFGERTDQPAAAPPRKAAAPTQPRSTQAPGEHRSEDWIAAATRWTKHRQATVKRDLNLPRSSSPEGQALNARLTVHGLAAVLKVIDWAWTSSHDRATFLRSKECSMLTYMRPANFEAYLYFAGAEPERAKPIVSYVPGQQAPETPETIAVREATRAKMRRSLAIVQARAAAQAEALAQHKLERA